MQCLKAELQGGAIRSLRRQLHICAPRHEHPSDVLQDQVASNASMVGWPYGHDQMVQCGQPLVIHSIDVHLVDGL
eukprot:scaffold1603_cov249-Pinguiococcus_pyrenoidosus.AAC.2